MCQTIVTKWLPPTKLHNARFKAQCEAGSIVVRWDPELDPAHNHEAAAKTLCSKLGWAWRHKGGRLPRPAPHLAAFFSIDG